MGELMSELVDRYANLLGNGILHGNLLCELSEHRDDLVGRDAGTRLARKGAQEWIVSKRAVPLALQVGIRSKLGEARLSVSLPELGGAVERARLSESCAHLRPPCGLQSGKLSRKLWDQALRGIL
jgi:hypothetical protein